MYKQDCAFYYPALTSYSRAMKKSYGTEGKKQTRPAFFLYTFPP